MNNNGFITLDRNILKWRWYKDSSVFKLFIYCLLKANWEDGEFGDEIVKRGSFITSIKHLSKDTGLTIQQVRTALKKLERTGEIFKQTSNTHTTITITNYSKYQDKNATNEQQTSNKRVTTIEIIKKKKKEELNKKNNIYVHFETFWKAYPKKQHKKDTEKWFLKNKPNEQLMDKILSSLEKFKRSKQWQKDNGQYIPLPSTWLNKQLWEDEFTSGELELTEEEQKAEEDKFNKEIEEMIERGKI